MLLIDINTKNLVGHVHTLSKLHRSALPAAVMQTLNGAAFTTKTVTMPKEADRFEKRKPTFFKANSKVAPARGFNIDTMKAEVGFVPKPGDKSQSVEDLEAQEHHGTIANRAFIALPTAREGNSFSKRIKRSNYMDRTDGIFDPEVQRSRKGKATDSLKMSFILTAMEAGKGKLIFGTDRKKGARVVFRINKVARLKKTPKSSNVKTKKGNTFVGLTELFNVKAGRKVRPDSKYSGFMKKASLEAQKGMEATFIAAANKQIAKFTRR